MNNAHFSEETFDVRHIGPSIAEEAEMLKALGLSSLDELIDKTVPAGIRLTEPPKLPKRVSESEYLKELKAIGQKNLVYKSHIGMGYYDCIVPTVIQRNVLENPGWYTQYTPYQAEIAQGRLEALLNFQTMVMDITGMDVANASLLDEGTAAAEAMIMTHTIVTRKSKKKEANKFFVSEGCYPQTIEVIQTRAKPLGFEIVVGDHNQVELDNSYFGAIVQYPADNGNVHDYSDFVTKAHELDVLVTVAADLLSLILLTPPGEFDADIVVGNCQRFGVPMGFGGPHAAYFATKKAYLRMIPGRIIGVSIDMHEKTAFRMTLQTREQHIRREKATSNICTAQALLAIMSGMYAVYHGAAGLKRIASNVHYLTCSLSAILTELGYTQNNTLFFDTLNVTVDNVEAIRKLAIADKRNFRYTDDTHVAIALDETCSPADVHAIASIFAQAAGKDYTAGELGERDCSYPESFRRKSEYLTHEVFNLNHSETEVLRYLKSLENKDLSLAHSMIPLGSCTMKLNATSEMVPITWPEFAGIHPFVPRDQVRGYMQVIDDFENHLNEITGFAATSFMPNSGAQGEYAGLLVIRGYQEAMGEGHRDVTIIPSSAHGTNPASAVMAGCKVVVVACDEHGNIDVEDLRSKAEEHKDKLSALMVTYPSTHGVFEAEIKEMCKIVHDNGGQVYMDGANMNAQVGITSPAAIGADVCHLNLHKTFAIPHGGGGPGMGPICVASHLAPFLPGHSVSATGGNQGIGAVSSAPFGSAAVILISYGYVRMLGLQGVTDSTKFAILNANYLRKRLEDHFKLLYSGENNMVGHEFILDCRDFKHDHEIEVEDIAKRLIDYGFHAPTVSFPVAGTLMVEPTESESKAELDRFADALIAIRAEIEEIVSGKADKENNVLKNAPHSIYEVSNNEWPHPYSRQQAAFPLPYLLHRKFWVPVGRINNSFGDRNVVCACPPIEDYM
jgi:glycine cleavage system P protein (glycine dehydrogenase)